jgi:hypothetical protein
MKTYEGGEEITLARLGKECFRIVLGLLKIVTCVALITLVIWFFVPDPWWRYLSLAVWVCGSLSPLWPPG